MKSTYYYKTNCQICGKSFEHLGSHIWHKHKITAREYKREFELPFKMSLISEEIKRKKQAPWHNPKKRAKMIKNLIDPGDKYQFKKGDPRCGPRRISEHERRTIIARIKNVNEKKKQNPGQCPICKTYYKHLESHLYNKHRLIMVK